MLALPLVTHGPFLFSSLLWLRTWCDQIQDNLALSSSVFLHSLYSPVLLQWLVEKRSNIKSYWQFMAETMGGAGEIAIAPPLYTWLYARCMHDCTHDCMHDCMQDCMYNCMYNCMHDSMHDCMHNICMTVCMISSHCSQNKSLLLPLNSGRNKDWMTRSSWNRGYRIDNVWILPFKINKTAKQWSSILVNCILIH